MFLRPYDSISPKVTVSFSETLDFLSFTFVLQARYKIVKFVFICFQIITKFEL